MRNTVSDSDQPPAPPSAPDPAPGDAGAMLAKAEAMRSWAWDTNQAEWGEMMDFLLAAQRQHAAAVAERDAEIRRLHAALVQVCVTYADAPAITAALAVQMRSIASDALAAAPQPPAGERADG